MAESLTMKALDARLRVLEEQDEYPLMMVDAPPEWLDDVLQAVVAALYQLRSQGAYNMAKELEGKYFPGGVDVSGDVFTTASSLKTAGG